MRKRIGFPTAKKMQAVGLLQMNEIAAALQQVMIECRLQRCSRSLEKAGVSGCPSVL